MDIVAVNGEARQLFQRSTIEEARSLAGELEKEGHSISIDGEPYLNSAGPEGKYLHQGPQPCPRCVDVGALRCTRCTNKPAEYYSVKPTHYHSRAVDGVPGHAGVHDILCYDCHRKDRFEIYGPTYGEAVA